MQEEEDGDTIADDDEAVIGFWSGIIWLVLMTCVVALLSEFVVQTIEVRKIPNFRNRITYFCKCL